MNSNENRMKDILSRLKNECSVVAIKAEFEAEGSRTDELVRLNEIVFRNNLNMIIKIGGCEAVRDLDECKVLGASGIMAPMIETPFAMGKYIQAIQKVFNPEEQRRINFIINAETATCADNFDDILKVNSQKIVDTVVVGRHDLSASLGVDISDINGDLVFEKTKMFLVKARENGLVAAMGGKLLPAAIPFINKMAPFLDKIETRKVVFKYDDSLDLMKCFKLAVEFELLYLKNKQSYYSAMAREDESRIKSMEKQLLEIKA